MADMTGVVTGSEPPPQLLLMLSSYSANSYQAPRLLLLTSKPDPPLRAHAGQAYGTASPTRGLLNRPCHRVLTRRAFALWRATSLARFIACESGIAGIFTDVLEIVTGLTGEPFPQCEQNQWYFITRTWILTTIVADISLNVIPKHKHNTEDICIAVSTTLALLSVHHG